MSTRLAFGLALLAAALLAAPSARAAQQAAIRPPGLGIRVVDPADGARRAGRSRRGERREGVSGEAGWVRLPGVPPGRVFVLVTRIGYRPAEFHLQVPLSGGLEVDVELEPAPVAVQGVTAVGRSENGPLAAAGFYRRRETGWAPS